DAAQLLAGMHSNHRNLIRQAIQAHQICTGLEFIDSLIHLHRNTYRKKNITYPISKELLAGIIKAAIDKKQGEILVCKNEREQITAGIFIVWDTQFAYLLLSAGAGVGTHPGAVRLLIFEALQLAQKMGIQYFDFEGSMEPGIAAFFKRFGGVKKEYLEWKHYPSLLWRLKKKILG